VVVKHTYAYLMNVTQLNEINKVLCKSKLNIKFCV